MKTKGFVKLFAGLVAWYLLLQAAVWNIWVKPIVTGKFAGGDLCRMGYVYGSRMQRQADATLPVKHLEMNQYHGQPIDVLTFGDSFSNSGFVGPNGAYQDYIASKYHNSVLNVVPYSTEMFPGIDPVRTLILLCNSGYLDKIHPKVVILESVERAAIDRLGKSLNFGITTPLDEMMSYYHVERNFFKVEMDPPFINDGNLKFVINNTIFYPLVGRGFDSRVNVRRLKQDLFSVQRPAQLVYYPEDIEKLPLADTARVSLMNSNLNRLSEMLEKKNIKFIFMLAVDKSNLYRAYVTSNPYPESRFFEELRKLEHKYLFIDTKAILLNEVASGVKDVYYADDTHWSWHASEAIFLKNGQLDPFLGSN